MTFFYALDQLPPDEQERLTALDFEDDRANDATMSDELADIFGSRTSGDDLEAISDDEWEALRGD